MGMSAYILVIGNYNDIPKDVLIYPQICYDEVLPDTMVIGSIGECNTTSASLELAEVCDVDPWDFNTHEIKTVFELDDNFYVGDSAHWIEQIKRCLESDVKLYYMPNG